MPRFSVTSATLFRPVTFRTVFSRSLPFRYSMTSTDASIPLHSWNPASGPSVAPVPRSTRKLNSPYGSLRSTAMSASPVLLDVIQPDQVVVPELDLLERDGRRHRIEGWPGPASRPRPHQPPRVDGRSAGLRQLPDRDIPPVDRARHDRPTPVEQLRRGGQRATQDDRRES